MSEPFLGEIRIFAGSFAPKDWAFCEGQLLSIRANTPLFSILGTTYGGDGKNTFALPDFRGRAPMHQGAGPGLTPRELGVSEGSAHVTVNLENLPLHSHTINARSTSNANSPIGAVWANTAGRSGVPVYSDSNSALTQLSPNAISPAGGSQPHNNMQPYLGLSFIIALNGIFPTRS